MTYNRGIIAMEGKSYKILIVDDDSEIRETIAEFLRNHGYEPIQVTNALSVVRTIKNQKPDLMILDMKMPGADGIQIVRALKRENIDIPIVVISGFLDGKNASILISQGVKSILAKPIDFDLLSKKINMALTSSKN